MGVITSLNQFNEFQKNHGGNSRDIQWVKLKDGESVKITFLQELFADAPLYKESMGTTLTVTEHQNPDDYKKKASCTIEEEGRCYGCEQAAKGVKGWGVRGRFYANVLVDDGTQEPYVAILSQGVGARSITPAVYMVYGDSSAITNLQFRIQRTGMGTKTSYTATPIIGSNGVGIPEDYEVFDLEKICVKSVPYEEQAEFYGATKQVASDEGEQAEFDW